MGSSVDQITLRRRGAGLLAIDPTRTAGGYTLVAPLASGGDVFLLDMQGAIVHRWKMPLRPGRAAEILPNGNLAYSGNHPGSPDLYKAWNLWHGGDFSEVTPSGEVVWHFEDPMHHHDTKWMSNGHLLYSACAPVPPGFAERIPGGQVTEPGEVTYGDVIREVDREGRLVWEWNVWEHLAPEDFPIHPIFERTHWPLVNGLDVTRDGLVLMSLRTTSGVIGVDKATGEVRLHIDATVLAQQHAPVELPGGNILVFDNGNFRPGVVVPSSRVVEIDPRSRKAVWEYADPLRPAFFAPYMGSAQRLWNGNTHVTDSATGRLFEVTSDGEVVWEYVIPWFSEHSDERARAYTGGPQNTAFKTFRYRAEQLPWLDIETLRP